MALISQLSVKNRWLLKGAFFASLVCCSTISFAEESKAAWFVTSGTSLAEVLKSVKIVRQGKEVLASPSEFLYACDQITLKDKNAIIRIALVDHSSLRLDSSRPNVEIPCAAVGVSDKIIKVLSAITSGPRVSNQSALGGSRGGVIAASRKPEKLELPYLVADKAMLVSTHPRIFVTWTGGLSPFSVELKSATEPKNVAFQSGITERSTFLTLEKTSEGQYGLKVLGADGRGVQEQQIFVVAGNKLPPIPQEIAMSTLSAEVKKLFYADYLVAYEDGRYTFEALQQVAEITPQTLATQTWLNAWVGQ